jgi:hypothetical protein
MTCSLPDSWHGDASILVESVSIDEDGCTVSGADYLATGLEYS